MAAPFVGELVKPPINMRIRQFIAISAQVGLIRNGKVVSPRAFSESLGMDDFTYI
ncbi:hypothetical protein [uncultured Ruegeria sp.]|uniref:hypothetical protein n=1 Tax=uncultured Ruegeria sp. TaxID=259304 RepID=UPI0026182F6D|nr:hypothetical protein [uncultured Ruegeria sp.]